MPSIKEKRIYLDYAATTPVDPAVKKAMEPYFSEVFGNPGSLHWFGQEASAAVFKARRTIAEAIGADYKEIVFTGSATEANNLALRGALKGYRVWDLGSRAKNERNFLNPKSYTPNPRIIISAIEHESILETARGLEQEGVEVIYLPVSREGIVDLKKLESCLNERTILVSVMYGNNEIGTIQPIKKISDVLAEFYQRISNSERINEFVNSKKIRYSMMRPLFHTDAVQALQYLNCNVNDLGVDLMTLSAHKIYGPKGIGLLYRRISNFQFPSILSRVLDKVGTISKKIPNSKFQILAPIITGGGQEENLRSGTENVPYIVGFGKAFEINEKMKEKEAKRVAVLRDYFFRGIKKIQPRAKLNGPSSALHRLVNNLNIQLPGRRADDLLVKLDLAGIAASAGSACTSRAAKPSYVLGAIGLTEKQSKESIRFTLGRQTTKAQIDRVLGVIKNIIK